MFTQCEEARTVLLKRWLPEVTLYFILSVSILFSCVIIIKRWLWCLLSRGGPGPLWCRGQYLIFTKPLMITRNISRRKKGESLRQVEKFFLCVRAVMSMHLRSMCIKTLEDFIDYMRTYMVSKETCYFMFNLMVFA